MMAEVLRDWVKTLLPAAIMALAVFLMTMRDNSAQVQRDINDIKAQQAEMLAIVKAGKTLNDCQSIQIIQLRNGIKDNPCPLIGQ